MSFEFSKLDDFESLDTRVRDYFPTFIQNRVVELKLLELAVEDKNYEKIREYCHRQIGVASCYSCFKLDELTRYILEHARQENLIEIKEALPILSNYLRDLRLKFK